MLFTSKLDPTPKAKVLLLLQHNPLRYFRVVQTTHHLYGLSMF